MKISRLQKFSINLFLLIFLLSLSECASFNDISDKDKIFVSRINPKVLEATYSTATVKSLIDGRSANGNRKLKIDYPLRIVTKCKLEDTDARVSLSFISIDTAQLIFKKSEEAIDTVKIKGEFKNGFFYLNNTYTKCHKIPYIFGGCQQERTRIGLSRNMDLIVQLAMDNTGAFLIVFGSGYDYNTVYYFRRL